MPKVQSDNFEPPSSKRTNPLLDVCVENLGRWVLFSADELKNWRTIDDARSSFSSAARYRGFKCQTRKDPEEDKAMFVRFVSSE